MRSRSRFAAGLTLVGVALLLTGCTDAAPPTAPTVAIDVSVFQYRSDYAPRRAQIEISNRSAHDITVTAARFSSAWFDGAVASESTPSRVLAGATTAFPVTLAPPRCTSATASPRVTVQYRTTKGGRGQITETPSVPFDSLGAVHSADCAKAAFESIATITPASALRYDDAAGGPVALLDLTITPTGAPGAVTLRSTEDTTLLAQREGQLRTIDQTFTEASAPAVITLAYTPSRCEQHVVAEDKVGTMLPVRVDAGPFRDALFTVAVSPAVKAEIFEWFARYCGW